MTHIGGSPLGLWPRGGRSGGDQVGLDTACEPGTWGAMSKMHPAKRRAKYMGDDVI